MKQLVSILIPAFNSERWVGNAIQSAIAQTWPRKELIVVDDGSTDQTFNIALAYSSAKVLVIKQNNRGASAARNHALSLAQGDYIQWLDADDLLAPEKIARQMEFAEPGHSTRILLSGSWGRFITRQELTRFQPDLLWGDLKPVEWLFRKIDGNLWMAIESWLVSRRLTEMAGAWDETLYRDNDGEYFSRVIVNSQQIRFIPEARCYCRRSNLGISHDLTLTDRKMESVFFSLLSQIQHLISMENSPRTRKACLKLLSRWSIFFYPERTDLLEQLHSIADALGGQLESPRLRAKYQWLTNIVSWSTAKKAQCVIPTLRSLLEQTLERYIR